MRRLAPRLAEEVRSRAGVRSTLDPLARSDNAWMRDEARLAREDEYDLPEGP